MPTQNAVFYTCASYLWSAQQHCRAESLLLPLVGVGADCWQLSGRWDHTPRYWTRAVQKSRFSLDLVQCTLHLQTYLLNLAALLPPGKREHTPGLPVNPHTWIEEKPPKRISANKCWMCWHWFQYRCWLTNYNKGTAHLDPGGTWSGRWQWTCAKGAICTRCAQFKIELFYNLQRALMCKSTKTQKHRICAIRIEPHTPRNFLSSQHIVKII